MPKTPRLQRALKFSWWSGAVLLVFQVLELTTLDRDAQPHIQEPDSAVHAMAVFVVVGVIGGFLVGWFWNWRNSAWGSAALGLLAFSAFSGGLSVLVREPSAGSVEDVLAVSIIMGIFGAVMGALMYYERKYNVLTELLNALNLWQ